MTKPNLPTIERFWSKVDKNGPIHPRLGTACWIWTGGRVKDQRLANPNEGYGLFRISRQSEGNQRIVAHRFAYETTYGPLPEGMQACHHCDNRPCVRPDHLFPGTQLDNMKDMMAKGRTGKRGRPRKAKEFS